MEKILPHQETASPIKEIGTYFEVDSEGYVVNPASLEKIQEAWRPVIDAAIAAYRKQFEDSLHSVYVRGSVAKGTALEGISDVDTFAYVTIPRDEIPTKWERQFEGDIAEQFPFSTGVELRVDSVEHVEENQIMLGQCVCVYGKDLTKQVQRLKPGREMMVHSPSYASTIEWFKDHLDSFDDDELEQKCVWLMKLFLRTGFELTMERAQTYTRDLYPCYKTFAQYYPEKEPLMREALTLALEPTKDRAKLLQMTDTLGVWLMKETEPYRA